MINRDKGVRWGTKKTRTDQTQGQGHGSLETIPVERYCKKSGVYRPWRSHNLLPPVREEGPLHLTPRDPDQGWKTDRVCTGASLEERPSPLRLQGNPWGTSFVRRRFSVLFPRVYFPTQSQGSRRNSRKTGSFRK